MLQSLNNSIQFLHKNQSLGYVFRCQQKVQVLKENFFWLVRTLKSFTSLLIVYNLCKLCNHVTWFRILARKKCFGFRLLWLYLYQHLQFETKIFFLLVKMLVLLFLIVSSMLFSCPEKSFKMAKIVQRGKWTSVSGFYFLKFFRETIIFGSGNSREKKSLRILKTVYFIWFAIKKIFIPNNYLNLNFCWLQHKLT